MLITHAKTTDEINEVRLLFREYAAFLGVDLCFQGFEAELAGLPGKYAPPQGALVIAKDGPSIAGCVALRKLEDGICEMKRLFVRPPYKKQGIGRALAERIINEGRQLGYTSMRLDTLEILKPAIQLYQSLGFKRIEPYYNNPYPGVVYLELDLTIKP